MLDIENKYSGHVIDVYSPTVTLGDPSKDTIAVVACIHGDETVGKYVHGWLESIENDLENVCIKLIFGNRRAYDARVRYTEGGENMNRVFPGSMGRGAGYEEKQAWRIMDELERIPNLRFIVDFHSTFGVEPPFIIGAHGNFDLDLVRSTGVEKAVIFSPGKTLMEAVQKLPKMGSVDEKRNIPAIAAECGRLNDLENVYSGRMVMQNILQNYRFLPPDFPSGKAMPGICPYGRDVQQTYYLVNGSIRRDSDDMEVPYDISEFKEVKEGTVLARAPDGRKMYALEDLIPIIIDRDKRIEGKIIIFKSRIITHEEVAEQYAMKRA